MIRNEHHGDGIEQYEIHSRMIRFIGLIGTLSYVIPDLMLLVFIAYNAIFFHDRIVWIRTDYGVSLGLAFGLQYYLVPLFLAALQFVIDFLLLFGMITHKRKCLIPALVYHGLRCLLSVAAIIEFEQYVPDMHPYIQNTISETVDIDTIRMLMLIFAAIEILSWLCVFVYFIELSGHRLQMTESFIDYVNQ